MAELGHETRNSDTGHDCAAAVATVAFSTSSAAVLTSREAARHAQHVLAVKLEIPSLPLGECADICSGVAIDSHALEGHRVRHGRYEQLSPVLERDESLVEQVVHRRGQEQTIFAIEALLIAAVSPGLNVARDQVLHALHSGNTAGVFD